MTLQPHHYRVLTGLYELSTPGELYIPFSALQDFTGYDRALVRRACRLLARKGLAAYSKGLWREDGGPAGAGYCITRAGREEWEVAALTALEEVKEQREASRPL